MESQSRKLAKAEKRLEIRLPRALRDYYLVAGRERILNHAFNRLCFPEGWEMETGKLVFMEENQTAVVWGVTATSRSSAGSSVFQGPVVSDGVSKWWQDTKNVPCF